MSFEEALKLLAEKNPEKFRLEYGGEFPDGSNYLFYYKNKDGLSNGESIIHIVGEDSKSPLPITQDDIDEILALIGWEYTVGRNEEFNWDWTFELHQNLHYRYVEQSCGYPTKLEAAKQALIAIVEKEYPLQGDNQ